MVKDFEKGQVWYVKYPLEEKPSVYIERPAIIADIDLPNLAVIKVTKHDPRDYDEFDTPIKHCRHAKLKLQSTARVSKLVSIHKSQVLNYKGKLHEDDYKIVFNALDTFLEQQ